jgi:hypothetical protein
VHTLLPRLIGAGAPAVPASMPLTRTGTDELNDSDLTLGAWRHVALLASTVWIVTAPFSGRSVAATVALPVIMGLWVYAIVIVDRWVRKHQRKS